MRLYKAGASRMRGLGRGSVRRSFERQPKSLCSGARARRRRPACSASDVVAGTRARRDARGPCSRGRSVAHLWQKGMLAAVGARDSSFIVCLAPCTLATSRFATRGPLVASTCGLATASEPSARRVSVDMFGDCGHGHHVFQHQACLNSCSVVARMLRGALSGEGTRSHDLSPQKIRIL